MVKIMHPLLLNVGLLMHVHLLHLTLLLFNDVEPYVRVCDCVCVRVGLQQSGQ